MDASSKLRMVLDYVPCEACLAQPTDDAREQELLCSICARVHRDVAVRVAVRTTFLVERPEAAPLPVVIPPAPPEPAAPEPIAAPPVAEELPVELEAYEEPAEPVAVVSQAEPPEPAPEPKPRRGFFRRREAEPVASEVAREPEFEDVAEYTAPVEDSFGVARGRDERVVESVEESREAEAPARDDFVFMPPEPAPAPAPRGEAEEVAPTEEVVVEREGVRENPWAPPEEIFPEEPSQPQALAQEQAAEEVVEEVAPYARNDEPDVYPAEIVEEDEPAPQRPVEDEIVESTVVEEGEEEIIESTLVDDEQAPAPVAAPPPPVEEDEEIVETTMVEDEEAFAPPSVDPAPAEPTPPTDRSDLWRLRGFHVDAESKFSHQRIESLSHLSGHDPVELADRTSLPVVTVRAWVQVADLVQEAGIPVEAAVALVAAGVEGPRGLRELDADTILDRVGAFGGGYAIQASDLKRWKRRV